MLEHLAIVMDGNRRWARKNGLHFSTGYKKGGFEAVERAIKFCIEQSISYLSLYTFSLENFNRSHKEQQFLFNTLVEMGNGNLDSFIEQGIRICFVGDRSRFPDQVIDTIQNLEKKTAHLNRLQLNLLFCYGARQEILCGIKKLMHKVKQGLLHEDELSEKDFEQCLWTSNIPEPDLIIRTSGVKRLSNFLLYQAAYSEFYFLDCLWPDITEEDFKRAVGSFKGVQRNFGY